MNDTADRLHEEAGATVLAEFFPSVVTDCVRDHVAAKRLSLRRRSDVFRRSERCIGVVPVDAGRADERGGSGRL